MQTLIPDFKPLFFGKKGWQVTGGVIHGPSTYQRLISNTDWNLYVGINPSTLARASCRANASEVNELRNILIDIDPIDSFAEVDNAYVATMFSLCEVLGKGALNCATTVDSGRGIQVWIKVKPVVLTSSDLRHQYSRGISSFLRRIDCGAFGCRIDTSVGDLSRVARLPGSINQKTFRVARLFPGIDPATEGLDGTVLLDMAGPEPEQPEVLQGADNTPLGYLLPYLTARAVTFLTSGVAEPGRHAAAYAAAASLRDVGVSLDRAYTLVRKGAAICNPPLSPSESNRTTKSAYESYRKAR